MSHRNYLWGCLLLAVLAVAYAASGGVGQDQQADKAKAKAPTYKVEKGPFKIEIALKGVLECDEMTPVALDLEAWTPQTGGSPLIVHKAVEPGSAVRQGDPILWLDLERINQAIRDLEAERQLAELA